MRPIHEKSCHVLQSWKVVTCCGVFNAMCMVSTSWVISIILADDIEHEQKQLNQRINS